MRHLEEQKEKYQDKAEHYYCQGRYGLAMEFKNVVVLIEAMENYIKEKENGKEI